MILTCPSCGTQYVVKDGAIPPQGRQVRCAACKHSWQQMPEMPERDADVITPAPDEAPREDILPAAVEGDRAEAPVQRPLSESGVSGLDPGPFPPAPAPEAVPIDEAEEPAFESAGPDPFDRYDDEDEPPRRRRGLLVVLGLLLIAALALAAWFLSPASLRTRLGLADNARSPLELMLTTSDRQQLASGNELLAISGRIINPTDVSQAVPPIRAELRNKASRALVYRWTIAPPARVLPPGGSASFNSAEVDIPRGGDELTVTLGGQAAI
jgi:predicted Zn finger-like uncharacterized protein